MTQSDPFSRQSPHALTGLASTDVGRRTRLSVAFCRVGSAHRSRRPLPALAVGRAHRTPDAELTLRGGFTLVEMLVTTVLTAVLLAALLNVTAGISRDRKRLASAEAGGRAEAVVELLRRDLTNARTLGRSADGRTIVLEGHGGLARASLVPTGRLTRVTYRVRPAGVTGAAGGPACLVREQQYLDDPARPEPWAEVVAVGVRRFTVALAGTGGGSPAGDGLPAGDALPVGEPDLDPTGEGEPGGGSSTAGGGAGPIPADVRVGIVLDGVSIDEVIRVR